MSIAVSRLASAPLRQIGEADVGTDRIVRAARHCFAVAAVFFGIQHVLFASGMEALAVAAPWVVAARTWAWLAAAAFFLMSASLLAAQFLTWVFILHAPRVAAAPHEFNRWTSLFVAVAMGGGALAVAGNLRRRDPGAPRV